MNTSTLRRIVPAALAGLLISCAAPAFAAAIDRPAAPAAPDKGAIVIGQSAPLSGSNASLGKDIRQGALAYFSKINDAGGIGGRKIRLVTIDDGNDAATATANTRKLLDQHNAIALFGYASATLSIPSMPMVKERRAPFFAPFTGAETIRKQNEFVYTVRATYADEIGKIIDFWGSLGSTRVTVLHYDDTVGIQNFETVAQALKKFDKSPVSVAIKRNSDLADSSIRAIIASNPQVVMATTLYAPVAQMVRKLKAANKQYLVTSLSFAGANQIAKALGPDAAGISVALTVPTAQSSQVPIVKECTDAWAALGELGNMSVTAIEGCMAAKVLVIGIRKAGRDVTRESLQRALAGLGHVDVGGFPLDFKPGFHHGGKFVDIAVIRQNGDVRS